MVETTTLHLGDHLPVTQDDDPIGDLDHLIEAMGDEDHPRAALGDAADSYEKLRSLPLVQRGRRLIQDQNVLRMFPTVEGARNRNDRALGRRQLTDWHADVEAGAKAGDQVLGMAPLFSSASRK